MFQFFMDVTHNYIMYDCICTCMQYIVQQIPMLSLPDVCTNSPLYGKAFCAQHCTVLQEQSPPITTDLRGFVRYCGVLRGE